MSSDSQSQLVLVSNRGPVTFQEDGSVKRGTGGLVTALTGLASHRDAIWIASAMTPEDVHAARRKGGPTLPAFEVEAPEGGTFRVRFVESDEEAYDRFYNIFANPMLWFIQHYLWDLSNAPDVRRNEIEAFEFGYNAVNEDLARAVVEELEGTSEPAVMVHDYHLYTLPDLVPADVRRVAQVPEVVLDEPEHRVGDDVVEAVVGLVLGLDEADPEGAALGRLHFEGLAAVLAGDLDVLVGHRRGDPDRVAVRGQAGQRRHEPARAALDRAVFLIGHRPPVGDQYQRGLLGHRALTISGEDAK